MATLREYFATDFPHYLNVAWDLQLRKRTGEETILPVRVYFCADAAVRFIGLHMPAGTFSDDACQAVMDQHQTILAHVDQTVEVQTGLTTAESKTSLKGLSFSGRIYFYAEVALSAIEKTRIEGFGKQRGLATIIRDENWAAERSRLEKPLAFISHDSRDKDAIARPLAQGLSKRMCHVWYDEYSLKVGDSLRESIEKGLKASKKCVVILTPNFVGNSGWSKNEFNSIFTRELIEERKVVLPVWAGVGKKDVYEYSPSLADRVAVLWDRGIDQVVSDLLRAIDIYGVNKV